MTIIDTTGTAPAADHAMRAVVRTRYGAPSDVLVVGHAALPDVGKDEVLVGVRAAGVDRGVWHLVTISLIHRETERLHQARNAFAVGGVVEDPATGAAAAALAGYLRELQLKPSDGRITVLQGHHMGSPSELQVTALPVERAPGVSVVGEATQIDALDTEIRRFRRDRRAT